jgi:hypothetical protein
MWIARSISGELTLFRRKPHLDENCEFWLQNDDWNDDEKELFKRLDPKGDPFYYAIKWKHFTYNRFINDFKSYIYK